MPATHIGCDQMIDPVALQEDHATLCQILENRRAVTTVTMTPGLRILWGIYLTILEDAVKTLTSLIDYIASARSGPDPSP
jgi:hypothetical protein